MQHSTPPATVRTLGQYPTPVWAAEALVERHFSGLDSNDFVVEPSCGPGSFLGAIPLSVPAIGIEIDATIAELARKNTGRTVITGDFCDVQMEERPTVILGNPPFNLKLVDRFLDRSYTLLPEGGRCAYILPSYAFQSAGRVAAYADRWSLSSEMIPRNIYPGLSLPLVFAIFTKDRRRMMVGFALYREAADILGLEKPYREALSSGVGPVWRTVVEEALRRLGGQANLSTLYAAIDGQRPTRTVFWKEQIRRTLRRYSERFIALGEGAYRLAY